MILRENKRSYSIKYFTDQEFVDSHVSDGCSISTLKRRINKIKNGKWYCLENKYHLFYYLDDNELKLQDLEYLKQFILDLPIDFIPKSKTTVSKYIKTPRSYYQYMRKIARAYGCKVRMRSMNKKCPPDCYCQKNKRVEITVFKKSKNKAKTRREYHTYYIPCNVFTHELAHHIQNIARIKLFKKTKRRWKFVLKHELAYERTTERLAYFLFKKHFIPIGKQVSHRCFKGYTGKLDIKFLIKYHNCEKFYKKYFKNSSLK